MKERIADCLKAMKEKTPLVHAITNYVTVNDCANILLAVGASPAMCEAVDEVFEFSQIANALYLNIGTLNREQQMAMYLAVRGAAIKGIPIVIDPVGCAAIPSRISFIRKLSHFGSFSVIKGNMGVIKALAGVATKVRGVDSLDTGEDGQEVCRALAREFGCTVVATGPTDIISDGRRTYLVRNGTEMFGRITGSGCMVGALVAAFCAANDDPCLSSAAALLTMNLAGELAAEGLGGKNPGTFRTHLIDQVSLVDENLIKKRGNIICQ